MTDPISERFITNIKITIAAELGRLMAQHLPPKAIVEKLWDIPEFRQAFEMRAKGRPKDH